MHILLICDYFHPHIWGIEKLFSDLTDFLITEWNKVTIITSRHDQKILHIQESKNLTIYRVWSSRKNILWYAFRFGIKNKELLQSVDHIHTTTFASCLAARWLAKRYNKPVTITIHEIYDMQRILLKWFLLWRLYILYEYILCRLLSRNAIVVPSQFTQWMMHDIYHIPLQKIHVIYNQIDYDFRKVTKEHTIDYHSKKALFMGRLGKEKWLETVLHALPRVIKRQPEFVLIILVDDSLSKAKESIQKLIQDLAIEHHILRKKPFQEEKDLRDYIASVNLGVVPSMSEWFCYTAVQMEAIGLPLVVSRRWALPEVLHSDHYFIEYGDTKAIAEWILLLLEENRKITPLKRFASTFQKYSNLFNSFQSTKNE